ncbi:MAG: hypothetical protein HOH14_10905, partial [Gammaproteobacteria bacterium]|nr:hypothetical protein [Gammaproteobacteria bacterium]
NCLLDKVEGKHIWLTLDESQTSVFNEEQQRRMKTAFDDYFQKDILLEVLTGTISAETPAAWRERQERERLQAAITTFESDETVKEIIDRFSASIQTGSIEATSPKDY